MLTTNPSSRLRTMLLPARLPAARVALQSLWCLVRFTLRELRAHGTAERSDRSFQRREPCVQRLAFQRGPVSPRLLFQLEFPLLQPEVPRDEEPYDGRCHQQQKRDGDDQLWSNAIQAAVPSKRDRLYQQRLETKGREPELYRAVSRGLSFARDTL
jgi:hypothetical protein